MKNTKTVKVSNEYEAQQESLRLSNVSCLICPSCGSSDKYVEFYNEDMICQGCGYDLGRIYANYELANKQ